MVWKIVVFGGVGFVAPMNVHVQGNGNGNAYLDECECGRFGQQWSVHMTKWIHSLWCCGSSLRKVERERATDSLVLCGFFFEAPRPHFPVE